MESGNKQQREGVGGVVPVAKGEFKPVVLAGLFFFCVLCAMMMLRPVREAMGVESGMWRLRELFYWTAGVSLTVAILFGGLVSKLDRRKFIPIGFQAVVVCLALFVAGRLLTGEQMKTHTGEVFYVWYSVINIFVISIFWAYMADIWQLEQAKRLYPVIGVGGTLGAIAGLKLPEILAGLQVQLVTDHLAVVVLMCSICMFEMAALVMLVLDRYVLLKGTNGVGTSRPRVVGGNPVDGLVAVARSPYLLGISLYIAFIAVSSTFIYFAGAQLVVDMEDELSSRLLLFAKLDLWKQLATLVFQLFVTSRLIRLIGVGGTLCVLPVLTVLGFVAVGIAGQGSDAVVWGTFTVFQALHSACRYAFVRPARESLFSVLSVSDKYKAKSVIDLFVYRGGDVAGARADAALAGLGVASIGGMLLVTAPMAGVWVVLAIALGVIQKRKADSPVGKKQQELAAGT